MSRVASDETRVEGPLELVELLLERGANVNKRSPRGSPLQGESPLSLSLSVANYAP